MGDFGNCMPSAKKMLFCLVHQPGMGIAAWGFAKALLEGPAEMMTGKPRFGGKIDEVDILADMGFDIGDDPPLLGHG